MLAELSLTVGGVIFNLLVLPTLLDEDAAIPRAQSVPTAVVLVVLFALPYAALGLLLPAIATSIGGVLWGLVAIYRAPT